MAANRIFDKVLEQIQFSNLNFPLLLPPTLASPLKTSADDIAVLDAKNLKLEKDTMVHQKNYKDEVNNCEAAYEKIKCLQKQSYLESEHVKIEASASVCSRAGGDNRKRALSAQRRVVPKTQSTAGAPAPGPCLSSGFPP
jgi:hypothetical protein